MGVCVAIIGAGGKMGTRVSVNLAGHDYRLTYSERGAAGLARLEAQGVQNTDPLQAAAAADIIVLAVPDARIEAVSAELVPVAKPGATVLMLDPAAAAAGVVAMRADLGYVVCHPCHPALFGQQATDEARRDLFGGIAAVQDIVIALLQGTEEAFAQAEQLCRRVFAPVGTAHRITVEQMAILEPAMAEVVAASAAVLIGEALAEAVRRGVPPEAARAFMLGHVQVPLAIVLGVTDAPFSDAAKIAVAYGQEMIYRPDWRQVFEPERVREAIHRMLHPEVNP
jgi:D-apionate oxidoisomerase